MTPLVLALFLLSAATIVMSEAWVTCPPGHLVVICRARTRHVIMQGWTTRIPFLEPVQQLSLRPVTVHFSARTQAGPIFGTACVRVSLQPEQLERAMCRLAGLAPGEIARITSQALQQAAFSLPASDPQTERSLLTRANEPLAWAGLELQWVELRAQSDAA